ncbi:hypothetical protein [Companilactobacillus jidongensis]|uniref:hypothetical protein n=1 Tax=Companilactobacillus jidongensis TaxID=2486006 RepID=UPI000F7829D2|nr:hypothetical protein [Companilactobacillus jidongensis]
MKRIMALLPVFILIILLILGIQLKNFNYLTISLVGMLFFIPIMLFIGLFQLHSEGVVLHNFNQYTTGMKWFYGLSIFIWVLNIVLAMYFGIHN